jgi:hypothetical protein
METMIKTVVDLPACAASAVALSADHLNVGEGACGPAEMITSQRVGLVAAGAAVGAPRVLADGLAC